MTTTMTALLVGMTLVFGCGVHPDDGLEPGDGKEPGSDTAFNPYSFQGTWEGTTGGDLGYAVLDITYELGRLHVRGFCGDGTGAVWAHITNATAESAGMVSCPHPVPKCPSQVIVYWGVSFTIEDGRLVGRMSTTVSGCGLQDITGTASFFGRRP